MNPARGHLARRRIEIIAEPVRGLSDTGKPPQNAVCSEIPDFVVNPFPARQLLIIDLAEIILLSVDLHPA